MVTLIVTSVRLPQAAQHLKNSSRPDASFRARSHRPGAGREPALRNDELPATAWRFRVSQRFGDHVGNQDGRRGTAFRLAWVGTEADGNSFHP